MADIVGLVLPFFGMIFIGAVAAKLARLPLEALGWLNIFVIYIALPALFFQLLSRTPIEQLTEWRYIAGSLVATFTIFCLMFAGSLIISRSGIAESTIKGLASAYGNIGFMGPGLVLLVFGPEAAVPMALIFSFENIMHFTLVPFLMALAGDNTRPLGVLIFEVIRRILLHPFILATLAGGFAAWVQFVPPAPLTRLLDYLAMAAAPCALFAMGVTLALRPLKRVPHELSVIVALKLMLHPLLCWLMLSLFGNFSDVWVYTAVVLAALPTATNVFVLAQQYGAWVERASASVLITTMLSVASLTGVIYLLVNGVVPADLFP